MLQVKDARTASTTVAGVNAGDHDAFDSGDQYANTVGHDADANAWEFQYDDSQAMNWHGNLVP